MGRDLLYKPQVPVILDDQGEDSKTSKSPKAKSKGPLRGRDLGRVGTDALSKAKQTHRAQPTAKPKAFQAAYFNKDISGVRQVNLGTSNMKALRGSNEATDLRKIVLPSSSIAEVPDPAQIKDASGLMGLETGFRLDISSLLGRQAGWAQAQGVTVEMLKERMEQMKAMAEARRIALKRMMKKRRGVSVTIEQGADNSEKPLESWEDITTDGTELAQRTADQASGMHRRIAKMMGIKIE